MLKHSLDVTFGIKNLGHIKYYLGLEVSRSSAGIFVHRRKFVLDMLKDTGFLDAKPLALPLEQNVKLKSDVGDLLSDPSLYRKTLDKLLYLTASRPDIAFTVHLLKSVYAAA